MNNTNSNRTPALKEIRALLNSFSELQKIEESIAAKIGLNGKSFDASTLNKLKVFAQRSAWGSVLDPILKESHVLARKKEMETQEKRHLTKLRKNKEAGFELFKMLPDLGYTHTEWLTMPDELKVQPLGRPPIPDEILYKRSLNAFKEEKEYFVNEVLTSLTNQEIGLIKKQLGHSLTVENILGYGKKFLALKTGGRKAAAGELSKIERRIAKLDEELDYYEGDKAKKDYDEEMNRRARNPNKHHGRPPMTVAEKLKSLYTRKDSLIKDIIQIEQTLTPAEALERRIVVARKRYRDSISKMEAKKLDPIEDAKHPLTVESRKLEETVKLLTSYRDKAELSIGFQGYPMSEYTKNIEGKIKFSDIDTSEFEGGIQKRVKGHKLLESIAENLEIPERDSLITLSEMKMVDLEVPKFKAQPQNKMEVLLASAARGTIPLSSMTSFKDDLDSPSYIVQESDYRDHEDDNDEDMFETGEMEVLDQEESSVELQNSEPEQKEELESDSDAESEHDVVAMRIRKKKIIRAKQRYKKMLAMQSLAEASEKSDDSDQLGGFLKAL